MSKEEEDLIIRMHKLIGNRFVLGSVYEALDFIMDIEFIFHYIFCNRWSLIAGRLPGRTDNEVKNYWNTHLNKKCRPGKRKGIELGSHQSESGDNNNNNINRKKQPQLCDSQPKAVGQRVPKEKSNNMTEDTTIGSLNCETELCGVIPSNNGTFVFDEEPFITYLDSLILFECIGTDDTFPHSHIGMGMQ